VIAEAATGQDWLVGGRTFDEQHFSPLRQITDQNSRRLGLVHRHREHDGLGDGAIWSSFASWEDRIFNTIESK
jgi:hypothetical protein